MFLPYATRQAATEQAEIYATLPLHLPEYLVAVLRGRWPDSHPGDFFLTALAAYLARLGGVSPGDIGYRDVAAQDDRPGVAGFFAAHVPLRLEVDATQGFARLYQILQEELTQLREFQTYARDVVARHPLLRAVPELQKGLAWPVIVVQSNTLNDCQAVPGSVLTMVISAQEATCSWVYDTAVLEPASAVRMADQFVTLLQGMAAHPERRLADLPVLTAEERHQLLVGWNQTATDYPHEQCFPQLFEAQVEQTPEAVAVVYGAVQLTYQELNARANQLAAYLGKLGVGCETLVGICMERSIDMLVGMLGVLKAGAVYVPLDPAYPPERLAVMLADTQAPLLLTQQHLVPGLPEHSPQIVCVDVHWSTIAQEPQDNPRHQISTNRLAYVLYTSGSTGRPNGGHDRAP